VGQDNFHYPHLSLRVSIVRQELTPLVLPVHNVLLEHIQELEPPAVSLARMEPLQMQEPLFVTHPMHADQELMVHQVLV